jgi:oxygen-independent coproporphyrinogen III oxidase
MMIGVWTYYPELLERAVPRYTSYPTAADFHDGVSADAMGNALAGIGQGDEISLYLHIPYCREICWYCGCNTGAANRPNRLESYLHALDSEVSLIAKRLGERGKIRRIAFGGGSPNAIASFDFVRLVDRILTSLPCDRPDISVEIDPRIFDARWATTLARSGVSRVSLGVQSFSPTIQQAIGRIQPVSMIESCVNQLRSEGIDGLNFDLMYGLPDQSLDDLEETLDQAVALKPSRIALFGYAHLPEAIPRQRRIDGSALPDASARFAMAALGYDRLTAAGYVAIGFDHFALPRDSLAIAARSGTVRRNFQGFTEDDAPVLIGLGASAISSFPDLHCQNEKNVGRYRMRLSGGQLAASRGVHRGGVARERGRIIESLLANGFARDIGLPLMNEAEPALVPFITRGLISCSRESIAIEQDGLPYSRVIAACFAPQTTATGARFSNAI